MSKREYLHTKKPHPSIQSSQTKDVLHEYCPCHLDYKEDNWLLCAHHDTKNRFTPLNKGYVWLLKTSLKSVDEKKVYATESSCNVDACTFMREVIQEELNKSDDKELQKTYYEKYYIYDYMGHVMETSIGRDLNKLKELYNELINTPNHQRKVEWNCEMQKLKIEEEKSEYVADVMDGDEYCSKCTTYTYHDFRIGCLDCEAGPPEPAVCSMCRQNYVEDENNVLCPECDEIDATSVEHIDKKSKIDDKD
jgi:hypothetical protein